MYQRKGHWLLLVAYLWSYPCLLSVADTSSIFPLKREFEFLYSTEISGIPSTAKEVRIWVPLGSTRDGQRILHRRVESEIRYEISKEPEYGNELLYLILQSSIPENLQLEIKYHVVTDTQEFIQTQKKTEQMTKYLRPSHLMVINEEVQQRTQAAVINRQSLIEKARGIYEYVIRHMKYDKTIPGWGNGDTWRACQVGTGNCTDFHSLFISMAQAAEIPARFKIGVTVPGQGEGEIAGYHCWAEFYEEGRGWEPVDASEAWKHPERKEVYFGGFDTNKFFISQGRDIELVPRQKGGPINILFYPYVEVDGKPHDVVQTSFYYRSLT